MAERRKPGISVLIAAQNEEATVETCIRSFLDFGDELIVVDNGSTDTTKDIVRDLAARNPDKIRFFDAPDLPDLYHNRQYALERSRFQWIVRADADFIAYTSGDRNIQTCRDYLLNGRRKFPPAIAVPLVNLSMDLWHTGIPHRPGGLDANPERRYIAPPITGHRARIYRHLPGFRFKRLGRWEGTSYHLAYRTLAKRWPQPLWMHCTLKSDMSLLLRSERTNWRQLGDFQRFPTVQSYLQSVVRAKYATDDLPEAARIYVARHVLPHLQPYDPQKYHPYPALLLEQMRTNPVYRIIEKGGRREIRFLGLNRSTSDASHQEPCRA